jgi:hypothetical protein
MARQWVVTYQLESCGDVLVTEFYRGSYAECLRIVRHSARGSDDRYMTGRWMPVIGPAKNWDDFVIEASDDDNEVVFVGPWR